MITPNIKHDRWDQDWQSHLKKVSSELEPTKNKQVGALLTEGDALQTEKTKLTKEIRSLKQEQTSLSQVFLYHRQGQKEVERLNDTTNKATHNPREKNFLGTGTGTKWQTDGWTKKATDHFTPSTGKLDNLYKVKISGTEFETTEEQVIQTIARIVKALQKVDATDFEAKYNAKETDDTKQAQVKVYLKEIQDQAQEIVIGAKQDSEGNTKQPTYDFSYNYHKGKFDDAGTWQPETTDYNQPVFDFQHFFEFITLTHNQPFLNDLDKDKQKNVEKNESWQIFLKGEAYSAEQLKDYGIKINPTKTTLYKTSETDKKTISSGTGITGWLDLAHSISQISTNQNKLVVAFTYSPTQQLLTDLNNWTQGTDGFLTDGTNFTLPESLESAETVLAELESKKISSATEQGLLAKQISEKSQALKEKTADLKTKEGELDTLIKEIITKKREKLTAYNLANGFTGENKRTEKELYQILFQLAEIRYWENNGDATAPSSVESENTVCKQIEDLQTQLQHHSNTYLINHFESLASNSAEEKPDLNQALGCIKAGKYTDEKGEEHLIYESLTEFYEHFENKEKLVKLVGWEEKFKTALKAEMEKKDPVESLSDWQTKLKALDPLINETIFTQTKMEDFQKHDRFKNISGVESLIKKVMGDDKKVKAEFIETLKKEDAEVDDLAKMLTKFSAEKVIKLIHFFEYEKETADKQKELRRKFSWDRSKKLAGKIVGEAEDFTLAETDKEDFQKFLYQLATGAKSLASISKPTQQDNPTPTQDKKPFHRADNFWMYATYGIPLIAIGLIVWFWDKIKSFFGGPQEETDE